MKKIIGTAVALSFLPIFAFADEAKIQCTGGAISRDNNESNWATVRDNANGNGTDTTGKIYLNAAESGNNYKIGRLFLSCDTSGIPDDATITATTLELLYGSESYGAGTGYDFAVVSSSHAGTITTAEYDLAGTTLFSDVLTFATITGGSTSTYSYNATGIAAISLTGTSYFAVREKSHDIDNVAPSGADDNGIVTYWVNGSGFPVLTVTYTAAGGGGSESSATSTDVVINHDPSQTAFNAFAIFLASFAIMIFYFRPRV